MWDPEPRVTPPEREEEILGYCCVCGQPVYEGDECWDAAARELIHGGPGGPGSCLKEYIDTFAPYEIAMALGLVKKQR